MDPAPALPSPPALMRCVRPSVFNRGASGTDEQMIWAMDVRVSAESIELLLCPPSLTGSGPSARGGGMALAPGSPRLVGPVVAKWIGICAPITVGLIMGSGNFIFGTASWSAFSLLPFLAAVSVFLFISNHGRWFASKASAKSASGSRDTVLLRIDRAARTLHIPETEVALPLEEVRGVQLIHGIVDQPYFNYSLRQLIVLTHSDAHGWRRYLAFCDLADVITPHARAVVAFGEAIEPPLPAQIYRIRGWKTPETYLLLPVRPRRGSRGTQGPHPAAAPEPLGDGANLDPWRAAGFKAFDSIPERIHLSSQPPMCLNCQYSLEGLQDPPACPECGADFVANPLARS